MCYNYEIRQGDEMALTVDKDGKIAEKHLTLNEESIRESIAKAKKSKHKKILVQASQVKFNRRTA